METKAMSNDMVPISFRLPWTRQITETITIPRQLFEDLTEAAIELEDTLNEIESSPKFCSSSALSKTVEEAVKIRDGAPIK